MSLLIVAACDGAGPAAPAASMARAPQTGVAASIVTMPGFADVRYCVKLTACFTPITERAFACLLPALCEPDWDFVGALAIREDFGAPESPPSVGEIVYPAGFVGGFAPATVYRTTGNVRRLYVTAWISLSPNFQSHSTGINKLFHMYISGLNRIFFMALDNGLTPAFGLQQLAAPYSNGQGTTGTSVNLRPNLVPSAQLIRGQWHRVDIILVANTAGVANGEAWLFLDGRKVLAYDRIMFAASGTNAAWEQFTWSPTWGGTGDVVTSEMYVRADHITLRGRN